MLIDSAQLDPRQRFAQPVKGPSHRRSFKLSAVSVLVWLVGYGVRVLRDAPDVPVHVMTVALAAAVLLAVSTYFVLFGTTTIDASGISRDGLLRRHLRWEQIGRARFVRVPLSPRLVVLPTAGPMRAFFAGNDALEQAFGEIERIYRPG